MRELTPQETAAVMEQRKAGGIAGVKVAFDALCDSFNEAVTIADLERMLSEDFAANRDVQKYAVIGMLQLAAEKSFDAASFDAAANGEGTK